MADSAQEYVGRELDVFSVAQNWKKYWSLMVLPFVGKRVLEVGAGIGSSTQVLSSLCQPTVWVCLEPDHRNIGALRQERRRGTLPDFCEIRQGTLGDLESEEEFDSILYIDVLEHIRDDIGEIEAAAAHIAPNGHLIILAPAHPFLFSEFDAAIGHHRRYTRGMFADQYGGEIHVASTQYLDSAGLLASLGNRLLLRSSQPSRRQLTFWDQFLIPISRVADRILQYQFGRSILIIYRKVNQEQRS